MYHATSCALSVHFCDETASSQECEEAAAGSCCAEEPAANAANVGAARFGKDGCCAIGAFPAK